MIDLASMATDPTMKAYANWAVQHYEGEPGSYWEDLLFDDPAAPASFWGSNLPLQGLADGTGLVVARKNWNYDSTWLSFQCGNLLAADHQTYAQGQLTINRGPDTLLALASAVGEDQDFRDKSTYGNVLLIDDGGAGEQTYRFAQGVWYGDPGCTMDRYGGTADYVYAQGNYAAAYRAASDDPVAPDPATEGVRSIFYLRDPDYVIVYDRAATTHPDYLKQLQWHFTATPDVAGNSWSVATGSSKLFGQTFSSTPLRTALNSVTVGDATLQQIATTNVEPEAAVRYVTAMQVAGATTQSMDPAIRLASADGRVEGVQIGNFAVLFGRNGAVTDGISYTVSAAAGAGMTHYISDLTLGATYIITGADQYSAVASPEGVLTFTTRGTGAVQAITVTPGVPEPDHPPVLRPITEYLGQGTTLTFAGSYFAGAFSDADPGEELRTVRITSLPGHGVLRLYGTAVTRNQQIALTDVAGLSYTPVAGYAGIDVFGWNGADQRAYALARRLRRLTSARSSGSSTTPIRDSPPRVRGNSL